MFKDLIEGCSGFSHFICGSTAASESRHQDNARPNEISHQIPPPVQERLGHQIFGQSTGATWFVKSTIATPDGKAGFSVSCNEGGMAACYTMAREACGGNYDIIDSDKRSIPVTNPVTGQLVSLNRQSISIACKTSYPPFPSQPPGPSSVAPSPNKPPKPA